MLIVTIRILVVATSDGSINKLNQIGVIIIPPPIPKQPPIKPAAKEVNEIFLTLIELSN